MDDFLSNATTVAISLIECLFMYKLRLKKDRSQQNKKETGRPAKELASRWVYIEGGNGGRRSTCRRCKTGRLDTRTFMVFGTRGIKGAKVALAVASGVEIYGERRTRFDRAMASSAASPSPHYIILLDALGAIIIHMIMGL